VCALPTVAIGRLVAPGFRTSHGHGIIQCDMMEKPPRRAPRKELSDPGMDAPRFSDTRFMAGKGSPDGARLSTCTPTDFHPPPFLSLDIPTSGAIPPRSSPVYPRSAGKALDSPRLLATARRPDTMLNVSTRLSTVRGALDSSCQRSNVAINVHQAPRRRLRGLWPRPQANGRGRPGPSPTRYGRSRTRNLR